MIVNPSFKQEVLKAVQQDSTLASAPDYENNLRNKMLGYNIVFKFPNNPNPGENLLSFPAYTDQVRDNFNISFSEEQVYGRMDSIPVYSRTKRSIGFSITIPSNGLEHSREIKKKLNILVKNCYPVYQKSNTVNIIASPPLVQIFFSNFIYDSKTNEYLLGYFSKGLDITHDLSKGVFARDNGFEVYPKMYKLEFSFDVLHSFLPGYVKSSEGSAPSTNPINILGG